MIKHTQHSLECWGERELIEEVLKLQSTLASLPIEDIETMVDYDYQDEHDHFQEMKEENGEEPDNHVFKSKVAVENWISNFKKNYCGGK